MKSKTKSYEMDLSQGSIIKKMFIFALPIMCSGILQLLFGAMDIVVVGRFAGDNSLAAVGSNGALIDLFTTLFIGISTGVNVIAARYYGAKMHKEISDTVHSSILVAIICGLLLMVTGCLGARHFLMWMSTPKEVISLATVYLRIYFLGTPAMMIYNFGSAILRAIGDTRRPLYYLLFSGVLNVILNLFFVIGLKLDVAGVAIATVISQTISAVLIMRCLIKEESSIRFEWKKMCVNLSEIKEILRVGVPAGLEGAIFSIANVAIQATINSFGAISVSGNTSAANLEGFLLVTMSAFHTTTISFMSQNLGAKQYDRIKKILFTGLLFSVSIGVLLGTYIGMNGDMLLHIYSDNPEVISAGMQRLEVMTRLLAFWGIQNITMAAIRGLGYSMYPTIVSIVGICGLRIAWIATICQIPKYHNITMVYVSYPVSWIITAIVALASFAVIYKKDIAWHLVNKRRGKMA